MLHQRTGVYIIYSNEVIFYQVAFQAVIGSHSGIAVRYVLAYQSAYFYRVTLYIFIFYTVIANVCVIHNKHLACV